MTSIRHLVILYCLYLVAINLAHLMIGSLETGLKYWVYQAVSASGLKYKMPIAGVAFLGVVKTALAVFFIGMWSNISNVRLFCSIILFSLLAFVPGIISVLAMYGTTYISGYWIAGLLGIAYSAVGAVIGLIIIILFRRSFAEDVAEWSFGPSFTWSTIMRHKKETFFPQLIVSLAVVQFSKAVAGIFTFLLGVWVAIENMKHQSISADMRLLITALEYSTLLVVAGVAWWLGSFLKLRSIVIKFSAIAFALIISLLLIALGIWQRAVEIAISLESSNWLTFQNYMNIETLGSFLPAVIAVVFLALGQRVQPSSEEIFDNPLVKSG